MELKLSETGDLVCTHRCWDSSKGEFIAEDPRVWGVRQCGPNLLVFGAGPRHEREFMMCRQPPGKIELFMAWPEAFRAAVESGDATGRIVDLKTEGSGVYRVEVEPDKKLEALLSADDLTELFHVHAPLILWQQVERKKSAEPGVGADSR